MYHFGRFIAKNRILVIIIAIALLIPSVIGMAMTKTNYDILTYLPDNLDSVKGQEILGDVFKNSSTAMVIIEDMPTKDVIKVKNNLEKIDGVEKVIWTNNLIDETVPKEMFPDDIKNAFYSDNSTLLLVKFSDISSSETTMNAITQMRKCMNKQCFISGISAIIKDTKDLSDKETPFYVLLAVVFSIIVLSLTMKSVIIPFIFMMGIGFAVLYNMGTNIFLGEISYITKALAAVLQLGVTMDYSIFLLHRYDEEREKYDDRNEAMAHAIANTIVSISGSSLTTVAGFLALCFMQLTIGKDIGLVMVKGVILGVISTVTVLPALILFFDKPIHRFSHKTLLPDFDKAAKIVTNKYPIFLVIFFVLFIPSIYGKNHTDVYYNLDESLPRDMRSIVATNKLKDQYDMQTTHFIVVDSKLSAYNVRKMVDEIEQVKGINKVLAYEKFIGPAIPDTFIPEDIKKIFREDGYKLIIANSEYKAARDNQNEQLDILTDIVKSYDSNGMVAGEGALTKDLIETSDVDFKRVSYISILAIFGIILLLFQSATLPVILVMSIELAIFINMSIPFYTHTTIPFIASIVIGCIQLGATVDYAILMTTRFREEIRAGHDRHTAVENAVKQSAKSIVTSGLTFFASTAGVAIVSDLSLIKSLCSMIARGAIISMLIIVFILPSILLVSEKVVSVTSRNWKNQNLSA